MQDILAPGAGHPYVEGDALDHGGPLVWSVANVLPLDECQRWMARIDALGPVTAPITTAAGPIMRPDVRNNQRVVFDDAELAGALFARLQPDIPPLLFGMRAVGANERFRCYRYQPGHRFNIHYDGAFVRDEHERSQLTLMVYLNDTFAGGTTRFHDLDVDVVPRAGSALLFQHHLRHEGSVVTSGVKYVLRTDVMYRAR